METKIQGNTTKEGLVMGNLQGELADFVVRKYHEEFKGTKADFDTKLNEGEVLKHSNTIFNNFANVLLRQKTGNTTRVLTGEDVVQHWDSLPDRSSTYADTCGVAVFPNKGLNEDHRQTVLGIVGKGSTSVPLIVYGLKPVRCDNDDGFQFTESEHTEVKEAQYLQREGKVQHDGTLGNLVSSKKGVSVWTPSSPSGLRRLYRDWNEDMNARNDRLLSSNSIGRVQILQDPNGLDEIFLGYAQIDRVLAVTEIKKAVLRGEFENLDPNKLNYLPKDLHKSIMDYEANLPNIDSQTAVRTAYGLYELLGKENMGDKNGC